MNNMILIPPHALEFSVQWKAKDILYAEQCLALADTTQSWAPTEFQIISAQAFVNHTLYKIHSNIRQHIIWLPHAEAGITYKVSDDQSMLCHGVMK